MGMFDYLCCELPMPDGREVLKDSFQTKSLWCSMDRFTITTAGRLIYHKRRYAFAPEGTFGVPEHVVDIDMDYHGDLAIYGATPADAFINYVVRFTHGTVEYIYAFDELPEIHRLWLVERGQ